MPKNIFYRPYDLVSPDGIIKTIHPIDSKELEAYIEIEKIHPTFLGYQIDRNSIHFNIKSTFAQLGVNGISEQIELFPKMDKAQVKVRFRAFNAVGEELLKHFTTGIYAGKLFAADERRRVRKPDYLMRLLGKTDEDGNPLLILGEEYKSEEIIEQPSLNRTIVKIPLMPGYWIYDKAIHGFIPTIVKGLKDPDTSFRKFLFLHQIHVFGERKIPTSGVLLVKTMTMNIRTLFARVVQEELPQGFRHASADIIEPQQQTGDIFEFHGASDEELDYVPLEFYTLEPFREHFFFTDRDLLHECLVKPQMLFNAFETAPEGKASAFIVKGDQLMGLTKKDWIRSDIPPEDPVFIPPETRKDKTTLERFIRAQSIYTIAKAMQEGLITSQGIVLTTVFPSPPLKTFLINEKVTRCLKAIYFRTPSKMYGAFFSHDDRAFLLDLAKASVDVFWVDFKYNLLLKYVMRADKNSGMFVPIDKIEDYKRATFFGVYGSKLMDAESKDTLRELFSGLLEMQKGVDHPLLNPDVSIVITTGGGPGVMATGNKIANDLGILSCGHAVDFTKPHEEIALSEEVNPYIQAKMTYRLEHIIIRQAEFSLDFPIFFTGGLGTDFELGLEFLRIQVGMRAASPILLFGSPEYWKQKITPKFRLNRKTGTIQGSEWISNCTFCVQNARKALSIYYKYFTKRLQLGKEFPPVDDGFVIV